MRAMFEVFRRCTHCTALVRDWESDSGNTFAGVTVWSDGIAEGAMLRRPDLEGIRCPACHAPLWKRSLVEARIRGQNAEYDDRCVVVLLAIGPNVLAANRALRTGIPISVHDAHAIIHEAPVPLTLPRNGAADLVAAFSAAGAFGVDMTDPVARMRFDAHALDSAGYAQLAATEKDELDIRLEWWRRFEGDPYRDGREWQRYAESAADVRDNALRLFELLRAREQRLLAAELARQLERFDDALALLEPMTDESALALAALSRARRPELVSLTRSSSRS